MIPAMVRPVDVYGLIVLAAAFEMMVSGHCAQYIGLQSMAYFGSHYFSLEYDLGYLTLN